MFATAILLAQAGQVSLDQNEYWLVAMAVGATFIALIALVSAWALIRRHPPIEREIDNRIGDALMPVEKRWEERHRELHMEMLRLDKDNRITVAGIFQKLDDTRKEAKDDYGQLAQSINKSFQDLNLNIGRLEGQISGTGKS